MNMKIGEVGWSEVALAGEKQSSGPKEEFLKLKDGNDNTVRMLTNAHQYYVHQWRVPSDNSFHRVKCTKPVNGTCPVCDAGDRPKVRWLAKVLERKTGKVKIFDFGSSIMKDLKKLASSKWGPPSRYDITITQDSKAGPTGYYSIVNEPPEPLTPDEQVLRDEIDLEDLKRRSTPPPIEKVQQQFADLLAKGAKPADAKSAANVTAKTGGPTAKPNGQPLAASVDASSSEEPMFPDYDGNSNNPF